MRTMRIAGRVAGAGWIAVCAVVLLSGPAGAHEMRQVGSFYYDKAEETLEPRVLDGTEHYQPDVLVTEEGQKWLAWLQFVPGEGDVVWIGKRDGDGGWAEKRKIVSEAGRYAAPTLTEGSDGTLWLSYEAQAPDSKLWRVHVRRGVAEGGSGEAKRLDGPSVKWGNQINHSVAAAPDGGLVVVCQTDREGQFDVMGYRIGGDVPGEWDAISDSPRGDWDPDVAVGPDGAVTVVWDSYDGESFNVLSRRIVEGAAQPIRTVAAGEAFEGRADVTIDSRGRRWVLWEEGARRWGDEFRGGPVREWTNITDRYGPLHRRRTLHIAQLTDDGAVRKLAAPLPMPALKDARNRKNKREGVDLLGTYYERGKLVTDKHGRLWVVYRHFYNEQAGVAEDTEHHKERGWRIYARCLEGNTWSDLYGFKQHQRDGMQRLSVTPSGDGLAAAWSIGRTDRGNDPQPRGVVLGSLSREKGPAANPKLKPPERVEVPNVSEPGDGPETATVGGKTYRLFRGDLHRHTDLSLCFPFFDGSIEDTYRYAIDVAEHDFLGITDHTRDINRGDALSQLWWRSTKEVTRHRLRGSFFPYFSYERSHGDTDHNVISLRDDMLRNFPPPLPEFWEKITRGDTFTIPHAGIGGKVWNYQNDAKRPLAEIYQGFRDLTSLNRVQKGLNKGYHLGFIASSDHMSTRGSYACVWAPEGGREPIFRSMQARRTFGATDDGIRLVFRSEGRWMGERLSAERPPKLHIDYEGTAPVAAADLYRGREKVAELPVEDGADSLETSWRDDAELEPGEHYYFVHIKQADGGQAWASPIWVTVE